MSKIPTLCALSALLASAVPAQDPKIPASTDEKTTPSGLVYCVLKPGEEGGLKPTAASVVRVHYTGWLTDGTLFDSSVYSVGGAPARNEPSTFPLDRVIAGWTEGMQLMTKGSKFKFTIPGDLAYGKQGRPPKIPADATLIFEVELLDIIRMPEFRAANADNQKTTESGIKYEYIKNGTGDMVEPAQGVSLRWSLFSTAGDLVQCTEMIESSGRGNGLVSGAVAALPWKYLLEVAPMMKLGDHLRLEVPPALAFGPQQMSPKLPGNSTTVWELVVVGVHDIPAFAMPAEENTKTTESGLQYEVIAEGEGAPPAATARVVAHYTGWLPDGTLFDSSHGRGEPTEFGVNQVIPGWTEGLQLMKPGAIYKFMIPAELAYGVQGAPPKIGPNQALVFLVELVSVK